MKSILFASVVSLFGVAVASAAEEAPAPWHVQNNANGGSVLVVSADAESRSGMYLSLRCSARDGFSMVLIAENTFRKFVNGAQIKVADGTPIPVTAEQDRLVPWMIRIKDADANERAILAGERTDIRLELAGSDNRTERFSFPGLAATAETILKTCPPF